MTSKRTLWMIRAHFPTYQEPKMEHFVRTRFNYDKDTRFTAIDNDEPTKTQQHMKEECDINTIVKRFGVTGHIPQTLNMPMQGDFTEATDYQTSLNLLRQADAEFMKLPSGTRERFHNNPAEFIQFFEDPKNADEARKMGLLRPQEAPRGPIDVRVVPEPPPGKDTA